ncbi:MAG TPA: hypothetical protein VFG95_02860 [Nitrospiria bacterium]|nr:hypothetical protein [Nitrospiria bacterium]
MRFGLTLMLVVGILTATTALEAQSYRDELPFGEHDLINKALSATEEGNFGKVKKIVDLLNPLIKGLERRYSVGIYEEINIGIAQENSDKLSRGFYRLAYHDVIDLLSSAQDARANSENLAQTWLRKAYLSYGLLSPQVQKISIATDGNIRNLFAKAQVASPSPGAFGDTVVRIKTELEKISKEFT